MKNAVEVKLNIGKSSLSTDNKHRVSDQLAKYWLQLINFAKEQNALPLALIYFTPSVSYPKNEIDDSINEIMLKTNQEIPKIFWLSWRHIIPLLDKSKNELPMLLKTMLKLLVDQWGFFYQEIQQINIISNIEKINPFIINTNFLIIDNEEDIKRFIDLYKWNMLFSKNNNWLFINS